MLQFYAGIYDQALRDLREFERQVKASDLSGNPFLTKHQVQRTYQVFQSFEYLRKHTPFLNSILDGSLGSELGNIHPKLHSTMSLSELGGQLSAFRKAVEHELWMNVFMYIPRDQASFYEGNRVSGYMIKHHANAAPPDAELLFGQKVYDNFPGARLDVNEAGNCYASGRNTACVFHLTRVLERGLFVLAQDPKLFALTHPALTPSVTNAVLETWESLIKKIETAIDNVRLSSPPGGKAARRIGLDMYSGAAIHFKYLKDHWRNPVSHSRSTYDGPQALSAITKVREFMQHLADTIELSETAGMVLP